MFEVFTFLIENFQDLADCPPREDLGAYLEHAGFDQVDIVEALDWLDRLRQPQIFDYPALELSHGMRVYTAEEHAYLPDDVWGLMQFLETEQAINALQREIIIDALMQLPHDEVTPKNTKMLTLIVLWAQESELPVLIGDELLAAIQGEPTMQ